MKQLIVISIVLSILSACDISAGPGSPPPPPPEEPQPTLEPWETNGFSNKFYNDRSSSFSGITVNGGWPGEEYNLVMLGATDSNAFTYTGGTVHLFLEGSNNSIVFGAGTVIAECILYEGSANNTIDVSAADSAVPCEDNGTTNTIIN